MQYIEAKSILSKLQGNDTMFGLTYNMNLYRGCQHGCIYCDTRSECYGVGDISQISVKKNAIELLVKEIKSKRLRGTIGTGSMNDPYMPVEKELEMTRKAMKVIADTRFPVHVITKSDLVLRDIDLLQEISKVYAAVSITITTADDILAKKLEPNASSTSARFKAIETLAKNGIYTGVTLMPLLPFINDTKENIRSIVEMASDAGASYIIPMLGVTLRKGSRDYLYQSFDKYFPEMRNRYEKMFGEQYICNNTNYNELRAEFLQTAGRLGMPGKMKFYTPQTGKQLSLF
ncbi:radical SAM protein [Prevotella sp. 10(H)]|uniref:SPL family radical SAM protein n=1 Tax=Prevotella sp. 10(H) TaxID=1158294 RepID=UPI0004A6C7B4|nr:radical SAM protein [Prevotella sp. 10(H)]